MAGIGGVKGGANGNPPFQMDHHFADMAEPGRHVHGEHDSVIGKITGLEQRNKGRTSKEMQGDPPMLAPSELTTERPQPSSKDRGARVARP
jgi:hypothetical protein